MALTQYYVDPGGGSDTTGDGSVGTPWASIQHALDTITQDTTNGDQINLKAGTADVLSAALDFTTYGTPGNTYPLFFAGYASSALDGGVGEIDCNGYNLLGITTLTYVGFFDLHIHTLLGAIQTASALFLRCKIDQDETGEAIYLTSGNPAGAVIGCHVIGRVRVQGGAVINNYVVANGTNNISDWANSYGGVISENICLAKGSVNGAISLGYHEKVHNNIIYSTVANNGYGIGGTGQPSSTHVFNNIICNFSSSGRGIDVSSGLAYGFVGHNAFYNCATNNNLDNTALNFGDIQLTADPFVDAANGDFTLTPTARAALLNAGFDMAYTGFETYPSVGAINANPIYPKTPRLHINHHGV